MINIELLDYIKQQLKAGVSKEDIRKALFQSDWNDTDIDEAFGSLPHTQVTPPPAHQIPVSNNTDDTKNIYSAEIKFNPLKDAGFWAAFVLGGAPVLVLFATEGLVSQIPFLINAVFVLVWDGWIFFKKGKKGSFLVGFLISVVVTAIIAWPLLNLSMQKKTEERAQAMQVLKECYDRVTERSVRNIAETGTFDQKALSANQKKCSEDPKWDISTESELVVGENAVVQTVSSQSKNTDEKAIARDFLRNTYIKDITMSLKDYFLVRREYPKTLNELTQEYLPVGSVGFLPRFRSIPKDPSGKNYIYKVSSDGSSYTLKYILEVGGVCKAGVQIATPSERCSNRDESVVAEKKRGRELIRSEKNEPDLSTPRARDRVKVSQVTSVLTALSLFASDSDGRVYPNSLSDLSLSLPSIQSIQKNLALGDTEYSYKTISDGSDFILTFELESGYTSMRGNLDAGTHTATQNGVEYDK